jgi:MFS transporter, DHA1 family, inner membrane transport protein
MSVHAAAPLTGRSLAGATAALLLGVFAVGSEALVISPLLEDIASDLDVGIQRAGLAVSIYGLAVAVVAPAAGVVAHRVSRRGTVLLGLAIFSVAGILCAAAPTLGVLIAGRAGCGVGTGLFLPAAYAWVGDEVPYDRRARVMGRVIAGWALALVLGVPLGGLVGQIAGWREALAAMAALALAAAAIAVRLLPAGSGAARGPGRRPGFAETLALPGVRVLLFVNLLDMLAFYGVYTYLGSFLREELDVQSGVAAAFILLYGLGVAVVSFNGRVLDRIGNERAVVLSLLGLTALFVTLPWLGPVPIVLGVALLLMGTQQATFLTGMTTLVTATATAEARGTAVALMSSTTYIGVTVSAASMGPVFEGPGYRAVGAACAALALVAALVAALRIRPGS